MFFKITLQHQIDPQTRALIAAMQAAILERIDTMSAELDARISAINAAVDQAVSMLSTLEAELSAAKDSGATPEQLAALDAATAKLTQAMAPPPADEPAPAADPAG